MEWSTRRKLLYIVAFAVFVSTFSIYSLRGIIFSEPTCFDKKHNGFEVGVDCGGTCSLKCTQEVIPLSVKWAQFVQISPVKYDLVAMVANKNIDNASHVLGYTFTVYNDKGAVVGEYSASTTAPLDGDFPVVQQNVSLPENAKTVVLDLHDTAHFAVPGKPARSPFLNPDNLFEYTDIPRVYSQLVNTTQRSFADIPVVVLLYDETDTVYAINKTIIPRLSPEESKKISFTWPSNGMRAPTKIRLYPLISPFLSE
jgi:hypothetical protein